MGRSWSRIRRSSVSLPDWSSRSSARSFSGRQSASASVSASYRTYVARACASCGDQLQPKRCLTPVVSDTRRVACAGVLSPELRGFVTKPELAGDRLQRGDDVRDVLVEVELEEL